VSGARAGFFEVAPIGDVGTGQESTMGKKLYVGNLPFQATEDELQALFAEAGPVESVQVMRDMATGRARGFAFVEMATEEAAQAAISQLNESEMGGRSLTVNEARPQAPRGGGGGGGNFRGGRGGGGGGGRGGSGGGGRPPRW
jgi:RNA recognition motif-containing protein